jgi:phosphoglycolate phosphatase-like HAD superfamily hydrolase
MLDLTRIRAVCFDIDGTLSDTDDVYLDTFVRRTRLMGFLLGADRQRRVLRGWMMASEDAANLLYSIPDRLGIDQPLDALVNRISRWRGASQPDWFRLMAGAGPMLDSLAGTFRLAIVTSRNERSAEAFLAAFGLRARFGAVISAFSTPRIKPDPGPVRAAAAALGVPAEACLMVGDTHVDILSAKRAGAQAAGVLCGFGRREELERAGADAILNNTADLAGLLTP